MTHGRVWVTVGKCEVCGRCNVELDDRDQCVDLFACAEAWAAARRA